MAEWILIWKSVNKDVIHTSVYKAVLGYLLVHKEPPDIA